MKRLFGMMPRSEIEREEIFREKETGDELTTEEAAMYNAHLEGAISTEDYKVEPVEGVKYTQEDADTYNTELDGAVKEGDPKTSSAEIVTE